MEQVQRVSGIGLGIIGGKELRDLLMRAVYGKGRHQERKSGQHPD